MAELKRYTAQAALNEGFTVDIEGSEYNHMANVMRTKRATR